MGRRRDLLLEAKDYCRPSLHIGKSLSFSLSTSMGLAGLD
jgi:hypothetical protein